MCGVIVRLIMVSCVIILYNNIILNPLRYILKSTIFFTLSHQGVCQINLILTKHIQQHFTQSFRLNIEHLHVRVHRTYLH